MPGTGLAYRAIDLQTCGTDHPVLTSHMEVPGFG